MIWLDGRLYEDSRIPFDLSDRGLLLADGLFDTALALGGRVAFEDAHVERLAEAGQILGLPIDSDRIVSGMRALAAAMPRAVIRTTVTRGSGPRGLVPPEHSEPFHWANAVPLPDGTLFPTLSLTPTSIRRNATSPTARLKTLGYLDAVLATREARAAGFDEALFLNNTGHLACTAMGNIFLVENDYLLTPALDDGVLPGVIRALICTRLANEIKVTIKECSLFPSDLDTADALFMTNSLRLLAPIFRFKNRNIPSETSIIVSQLTTRLREAVAESCGIHINHIAS